MSLNNGYFSNCSMPQNLLQSNVMKELVNSSSLSRLAKCLRTIKSTIARESWMLSTDANTIDKDNVTIYFFYLT